MIKIYTTNLVAADVQTFHRIIDLETKRKINRVPEARGLGITTACDIDGEFCLVSYCDVPEDIEEKLKQA